MEISRSTNVAIGGTAVPQNGSQSAIFHVANVTVQRTVEPTPPQVRLTLGNIRPQETEQQSNAPFGTHIKEAIAIVKDWTKRP
jgi:hypothetical protein